jgi:hypothetical protein
MYSLSPFSSKPCYWAAYQSIPNFMVQSFLINQKSFSKSINSSHFTYSQKIYCHIKITCHWVLFWDIWIQSILSYPISLRSTLILFSCIGLGFLTGLFPSGLPNKFVYIQFSSAHECYMASSFHPLGLFRPVTSEEQIMKLPLWIYLQLPFLFDFHDDSVSCFWDKICGRPNLTSPLSEHLCTLCKERVCNITVPLPHVVYNNAVIPIFELSVLALRLWHFVYMELYIETHICELAHPNKTEHVLTKTHRTQRRPVGQWN